MSWKQAATFITIVFVIVLVQALVADPLVTLQNSLLDSVTFGTTQFDGPQLIKDNIAAWFNMGLVAVFVLMGVVVARAVRKELTRQRRGP